MNPKFTIIVPCYNAEDYIEKCVTSALDQDYENCEVIVIDNDSGDDSLEIVEEIYDKHQNFTLDTAANIYPFSWQEPVEKALSMFTGDYVTILGADDYLAKDYVSNIVNFLNSSEEKIDCFQSSIRCINRSGDEQGGDICNTYDGIDDLKEKLLEKCVVATPSVVYSRKLYEDGMIKWDSENYLGASDYELYFNLVDKGVYIHPNQEWLGYYYRWHEKQATWGMQRQPVNYDFMLQNKWRTQWGL